MISSKTDTHVTERQFRKIWQYRNIVGQSFIAENGTTIRVVYPGRPNDGPGADIKEAVIVTNNERQIGDVEFHLRSSDWRRHHHHIDPVYNRVILHVVKEHDAGTGTILQNGDKIPILIIDESAGALTKRTKGPLNRQSGIGVSCLDIAGYIDIEKLGAMLDRVGYDRFLEKSERFSSEIMNAGPGESLYRGVMEALGYSGNKNAFRELARLAPLESLEKNREKNIPDDVFLFNLQTILFGKAGFLSGEYMKRLFSAGLDRELVEQMINSAESMDLNTNLSPSNWRLFRIRPCNSPFRRLVAMSYLLMKYRKKGLLKGMLDLVDSVSDSVPPRKLENELVMSVDDISLLGKHRAAEIIVNVLLPFAFTYGDTYKKLELSRKAQILYKNYPRLEMNSLLRHMIRQLGLHEQEINTAIRQQGLIHIYKNLCIKGGCHECELCEL